MPVEFEDLIRQHSARIRRIAGRYASNGAVDDLVQEILVRLWRSWPGFRVNAKVETWIYRVALNASMTYLKDSIRERATRAAVLAHPPASSTAPQSAGAPEILENSWRCLATSTRRF